MILNIEAPVVVLADGLFPCRPELLLLLQQAPVVVCCDRAYLKYRAHLQQAAPTHAEVYVVGDGDSLPPAERAALGSHCVAIAEQDDNDLTKAVHFCFARGWYHLAILGATGLREDHTVGNISLLADYQQQADAHARRHHLPTQPILLLSDYGTFTAITGHGTFASFAGQQVSLFSLVPSKRITTTGLQYPLHRRSLPRWWQGTLNNAMGSNFTVQVEPGGILIVYQTHRDKAEELQHK